MRSHAERGNDQGPQWILRCVTILSERKTCGSELAHEDCIPVAEDLADVLASSRASSLPQLEWRRALDLMIVPTLCVVMRLLTLRVT